MKQLSPEEREALFADLRSFDSESSGDEVIRSLELDKKESINSGYFKDTLDT